MAVQFLEISSGTFFEWSKTAKPEFEAHLNKNNEHKGYRKYLNDIRGIFMGIAIEDNTFNKTKEVHIYLGDGEDIKVIKTDLLNQSKRINGYLSDFIRSFKTIRVGDPISLFAYRFEETATSKARSGLSIRKICTTTGEAIKLEKEEKFLSTYTDKDTQVKTVGDIPEVIFTKDELTGTWDIDSKAETHWLYAVLKQFEVTTKPYSFGAEQSRHIPVPVTNLNQKVEYTKTEDPIAQAAVPQGTPITATAQVTVPQVNSVPQMSIIPQVNSVPQVNAVPQVPNIAQGATYIPSAPVTTGAAATPFAQLPNAVPTINTSLPVTGYAPAIAAGDKEDLPF